MSGLTDILENVAPALATALGGPLAGAAVGFLAKKLDLSDSTVEAVQNAVSGMKPEQLVALKQADYEFQEQMAKNNIALQLAQVATNKAEATSANWFVAGWRPFVGWTCGTAFAYAFVLLPFLQYLSAVFGSPTVVSNVDKLPSLDLSTMMPVLLGMLGLGGMRTLEKVKNAAQNH